MDQIAITRTVTVAVGPFAAGHLGELTRLITAGEITQATRLARSLRTEMLLLGDRGYAAAGVIADTAIDLVDVITNDPWQTSDRPN
ncbi:hypothetical protein ACWDV4_23305 [Micromonospora sp. NPDC003197]